MKTSNKFFYSGLLLTLLTLFAYDLLLKTEFQSGRYKDPYSNYAVLPFRDFDVLDLNSSTAANVKFIQGSFSVRIDKNALEYVKVKQSGNRLQIDAIFKYNYFGNPNPYILVISCPKLAALNTNASYRANDRTVTDSIAREDWNMRQILVDGFEQDSLNISQDYGSTVVLANARIRSVNAVIGKSKGSGSNLIIQNSNQFQDAHFVVGHKSKLQLDNAVIHHLNYELEENAKLIITGKAQNLLNNFKPQQK
jgi:hypothetical protein